MSASPGSFPDRGPAVLAVTTATLVLGSIFVISRLVCRLSIVRRFGWDDCFIVFAWLLALGLSLTINLATRNGLGRHDANILADNRAMLRRCEYVFSILYNPALMATKTSILVFYLRLSKTTQQLLHIGSYGVLAIVNIAGIVLTFLNIFQCRPVAAAFSERSGQCIPLLTEFICSAPVNIVTDLAILALPIPVLTSMRLPSRQKTILVFTFALGVFVTVVDVVRIYYLQQAINVVQTGSSSDPSSIFGDSVDFSWNASFCLMWSAVEVNVGITCACIPTLKPLITKILPAMLIDPDDTGFSSSRARYGTASEIGSGTSNNIASMSVNEESSINSHQVGHSDRALTADATDRQPDLHPDPALDAGLNQHASLGLDQIATVDHAQDLPPLDPSVSGQHQHDAAGRLSSTPEGPRVPPSPRSHLARVASGTRHALATASNIAHRPSADKGRLSASRTKDKSLYFGFVKLRTPKNMLEASASESTKYCTLVAVLFFLWGFSYGLLNTLNNVVAAVANMTTAQTLGLTSAYFGGGYLFGPLLVGEWILRHDEHHRRRDSAPQQHASHRDKPAGSTLHSIPATAASVVSGAATAVTKRSRRPASSDIPVGGFKATFIMGLCFYGVGTIMFWPSSVLTSFPGFLISSFVVGFGLSILETAANPFIALCGPMEYAEVRLLIVQGAQGIGSVLSGLLAQNVFFVNVSASGSTNSTTLLDVQWTYLAITLFCVALAMFFYYMPLPELHDAELRRAASRLPVDGEKHSLFGLQLRTVCLALAVFSQWTYVASQESMSIYFHHLIVSWLPNGASAVDSTSAKALAAPVVTRMATSSLSPSDNSDKPAGLAMSVPNYLLICRTAFTVSRFFSGYILYLGVKHPHRQWLPAPRTILTASTALMTLFGLLTVVLKPSSNGNVIVVPVSLFFLAEGPVWPLIFAIGLRGQGTRTKRAAAYITMGASGPLFWPFVMYGVLEHGGSIRIAFIIVVALMAAGTVYPLFLMLSRDARELTKVAPLDPYSPQAGGTQHTAAQRPDPGRNGGDEEKAGTPQHDGAPFDHCQPSASGAV